MEVTEQRSSNWRELNNLVEAVDRIVNENGMRGSEIFIFTDNLTAEAAFWKGTSQSPLLFELVLRLKTIEMEHDLHLHLVHVSGLRMIDEGGRRPLAGGSWRKCDARARRSGFYPPALGSYGGS
jgi:hypothetical protein